MKEKNTIRHAVYLRLNDEQYKMIKEEAIKEVLPLSTYIKSITLRHIREKRSEKNG